MMSRGRAAPSGLVPAEVIGELGRLDGATVYNILKGLDRAEADGFSGPELRCLFPDLPAMVGYAVTAEWTSGEDDAPNVDYMAFLEMLEAHPRPTVIVLADIGRSPGRGGIAGDGVMRELQVLGAAGVVVAGSVMDIAGIERLRLPVYASGVVPAYGDLRLAGFGRPIGVGPLRVAQGDLLLGDRAGVVRIPPDAAEAVIQGLGAFRELERSIFALLERPGVTAADIRAWYETNEPEFTGGDEPSSNTLRRVVGREE